MARHDANLTFAVEDLKLVRQTLLRAVPARAVSLAITKVDEAILWAQSEYALGDE